MKERFIQDDQRKGRKGLPFLVSKQVAHIWQEREKGKGTRWAVVATN